MLMQPIDLTNYQKELKEALKQCYHELVSIYLQYGNRKNAYDMSLGIRMANKALNDNLLEVIKEKSINHGKDKK